MIYKYNKLVRDKIPSQINNKQGKKATFRIMPEEDFLQELNKKLIEESREFIEENNIEELADVMEVIESIMIARDISWEQVKEYQIRKREQKGGFLDRIFLEYVEEETGEKI